MNPLLGVFLAILVFSQMVSEKPFLNPLLSVFLFTTIILGVGFRRRKPYVIHAHMNTMFRKVFLLMSFGMAGGSMTWFYIYSITVLTPYKIPFPVFMIVSFIIVGFGCFALIHLLYWSLPFSRKTTGIKEVDAAITRYKKQNEEVAGAWEPPAMVDGTWYKLISYQKGPGGVLAFDKQGEVVRDLELMHKIHRCSQLAIYAARPDMINQRTSGYMNTQKAIGLLKIGLKKYDGLVKPIRDLGQAVNIAHAENVRRALLISQRYFPAVCEGWYLEAEWSNQRGNAHLKEVHYEEMLELSNRISEKIDFMTAETAVLITGGESALALLKLLQKHGEIDRQSPDLKHLLDFVLQARETAEAIQQGVDSGDGIPSRYKGLDDEKIVLWRERLKWVDQVDKRKA